MLFCIKFIFQELASERSKWEYIKYKIREWVQQQSKIKARYRREAVKQLEVEIKSLEKQLNSSPPTEISQIYENDVKYEEAHIKGWITCHYENGRVARRRFFRHCCIGVCHYVTLSLVL